MIHPHTTLRPARNRFRSACVPARKSFVSVALLSAFACAGTALGSVTYTPLAFGPLGTATPGQYFTRIQDISADGRSFIGVLNNNAVVFRTPGGDYSLTGTGTGFALSPGGQVVAGGQAGSNPQRWDLSNAVGNSIASTTITWPGGPIAWGPAYATNSSGSDFVVLTPRADVITPSGRVSVLSAFQAYDIEASPGAYRALAPNAPVMALQGSAPSSTTASYRWNYETGEVSPLQLPAGAEAYGTSLGGLGSALGVISYDGSIVGGGARFGTLLRPFWWDADGVAHEVGLLPGAVAGSIQSLNYTGTIAGGQMTIPGAGSSRAFAVALATGELFDLTQIYSDAGLLPDGWVLTHTQHISDDGSLIYGQALAPDGSTRMVALEGRVFIPEPAALTLALAGAALLTGRRRRQ